MFRNTLFSLFLLCFWFTGGYSQELEISYQNVELEPGTWETQVFMQNQSADSVIIRAVNFSFLSDKSCATFKEKQSLFSTSWSAFLERQFPMDSVSVQVNENTFSYRLLYGIAEPQGMKNTYTLKIPGTASDPLLVLQMKYEGNCAHKIMMEDVKQNAMNQIGDKNLNPMPYRLVPVGGE
jgi:hypothetical protein